MFIRDESVAYDADTVLVHTDEMGETVLIKSYLGDHESGQFVVQPAESSRNSTTLAETSAAGVVAGVTPSKENHPGQFAGAATSLLQLSQVAGKNNVDNGGQAAAAEGADEEEPIFLPADSVVEIAGHDGEFVIVNVNNEQKLMPISQLLMNSSQGSNIHQDHS